MVMRNARLAILVITSMMGYVKQMSAYASMVSVQLERNVRLMVMRNVRVAVMDITLKVCNV